MKSIHVETLAEAVEEVIIGGAQVGVVVAEKLPIREAAAFDFLMEVLAVDDWVLGNSDGVKAMARTSSDLLLLEAALLPALRLRPTHKPLLRVVSACAQKLKDAAADAGGSARKEAVVLADSISSFVADAMQVPKGSSVDSVLRDRVDALKEKCSDLLSAQFTIAQE